MNKYIKIIGFSIILLLLLNLLITGLSYINNNIINYINLISMIFIFFISGLYLGKRTIKKGYIEGIKIGFIYITIMILISIFISSINFNNIIYYLILLISSIFGSIFGINKKKN